MESASLYVVYSPATGLQPQNEDKGFTFLSTSYVFSDAFWLVLILDSTLIAKKEPSLASMATASILTMACIVLLAPLLL